jgi:osmotically-inducible protein OsmY
MARHRLVLALAGAAMLPLGLGGCAGVLVVGGLGAAAGGGYMASQERGIDGTANDIVIKTDVQTAFLQADPQIQSGVTTTVYNGRVLLTGRVASPDQKARAVQIAGKVQHVRTVHDEIEVAAAEGTWDSTWDGAKDTWIATQVRSKMVVDPDIRSVNYTIDTQNGSVYLIGSARSQRELELTTHIARHVPGVKRVVSYVELRAGTPVAAVPPGASGTSPAYNQPRPAPRTPIEVQKL